MLEDPDSPEWLLRLPMTKAAVRAMDTVSAWTKKNADNEVHKFMVAGASKRGWTTWTTAAVDDRVYAMAPIVLDYLNTVENLHHHYKAYGGWSFALQDYWELNFTQQIDNPNTQKMFDIVDPYAYRKRLTMPKLIINSGNDEFMQPDDQFYWWDEMPGPKHMMMLPNTEHSCATGIGELLPSAAAFAIGVLNGIEQPTYNWTIDPTSGDITVVAAKTPHSVRMWHSTTCNNKRRDFRIINLDDPCKCGISQSGMCLNAEVLWSEKKLQETSPGSLTYVAHRDVPKDGKWTAFFVDVQFKLPDHLQNDNTHHGPSMRTPTFDPFGKEVLGWPIGSPKVWETTTSISIIPQTFPFEDCSGEACQGVLV